MPRKVGTGCVRGGLRGVSPAGRLGLGRRRRLIASRRGAGRRMLGAVRAAGVDLKLAQSNNGIHPTADSALSSARLGCRFRFAAAGDAGR